MKKYAELVQEIQKYAEPPPQEAAAKPKGHGGPWKPQAGSAGNFNASVAAMQNEMIALARDVKSAIDVEVSTSDAITQKGGAQVASGTTKRSKRGFMAFFTEYYTSDLPDDLKGNEFSPDAKKTSLKDKQPTKTELYDLDIVMDTMSRIGNPQGGEMKPDGFWGFRTDNALRNFCAFAYALLQLKDDFQVPANSYEIGYWNTLTHQFAGYEVSESNSEPIGLPDAERTKRAKIIKIHLKAVMIR